MSYIFKTNFVPADKYGVKCPYPMVARGICVHNTANDAPAENEIKYMITNNNQVSFHVAVDDKEVVQGIPFDRNAWHAGDGGNGNGNRKYLAVEICYSKSGGDRFIQAEKNAAKWIAETLRKHNWTIANVKKHQDFSGKYCPHRTLDMGWQRFLDMVQTELNKLDNLMPAHKEPVKTELYRVRKSWSDASTQIGAYADLNNAKAACKTGYSIFDSNGNIVYTPTASVSHKYSVGQYVTFGTSYPSSTLPCGIIYATSGSGKGEITAVVDGQAKYQIDNGRCYINDRDISGTYTPQAPAASANAKKVLNVNAYYKVYAGSKWYDEVKNLEDYAGDGRNAISAIAVRVDNGNVKYRVHVRNGEWYPYVTGYNMFDGNNGYAGDKRNDIDAVEVYYTTPSGYICKKAKYRLAPIGKDYYSWQYDNETSNGQDGYAGNFGTSFGKFQIVIE